MTMQDKIMTALRSKVQLAGMDFVVNYVAANVGTVRIQHPGQFETLWSFHFDFQDSYCTLQFYPAGVKPVGTCGFTDPKCIKHADINYEDTVRLTEILAFAQKLVDENRLRKPRTPRVVYPGFEMVLQSFGNPDYGQTSAQSPKQVVHPTTLGEAQKMVRAYIESNNLGGGNWKQTPIRYNGAIMGYFSYNGRLWKTKGHPAEEIDVDSWDLHPGKAVV